MCLGVESYSLVAWIQASDKTFSAIDTEIIVNDREFLLFGHMIDIFEVMITCASDIF